MNRNTEEQSAKLALVEEELKAVLEKHKVSALISFGFSVPRSSDEKCRCGNPECDNEAMAGKSLSRLTEGSGLGTFVELIRQNEEHAEKTMRELRKTLVKELNIDGDLVRGFADLLAKAAAKMDEKNKKKANEETPKEPSP